jgi:hypothetical protein
MSLDHPHPHPDPVSQRYGSEDPDPYQNVIQLLCKSALDVLTFSI